MRSFILLSLSTLTVGCGTVMPNTVDVSNGEVTSIDQIDDLDGNGVSDYGNQSFAFGTTEIGAAMGFFFSETMPSNSIGLSMSTFGFGSEEYSSSNFGWETPFLPLPEMTDSNGRVVGYGANGLRDGLYEINCGLTSATPHTQDGWCQAMEGLTGNDDVRYLAPIVNGSPECAGMAGYDETGYRTDYNWSFVVENGVIRPMNGSFAPPDTDCHEE